MSYGATASDIAAFNAIGSNDVERMTPWVDDQLDRDAIDDTAVESRLAAAGYTTLGKSLKHLLTNQVEGDTGWEVRKRPSWESERACPVMSAPSRARVARRAGA